VHPSVSVIIPTWNRAATIQAAVESALRQSIPVLEVLVCDDGSMDETATVVGRLSSNDRRVRWLPGERGGRPAIPRNRGIHESRGEWLAFLDSDDAWLPEKLSVQLEAMSRARVLAACSNAVRVTAEGGRMGDLLSWPKPALGFADLLSSNWVVCSSCILHRDAASRAGGFPEAPEFKAIEDYALWLRVAALTDFAYSRRPLVLYRDDVAHSIRIQQEISPDTQKRIVLDDIEHWLRTATPTGRSRLVALLGIRLARIRLAMSASFHAIRRALAR
jgi:glycosyltransferase involved in cell wall biosynthesis